MKMKFFTFILTFTMVSSMTFAQSFDYYVTDNDTIKGGAVGDWIEFSGHVANNSNKSITTSWTVVKNFPDTTWSTFVCDGNQCYGTDVMTQQQGTMAGASSLMKATIIPGSVGTGSITITVEDLQTNEKQSIIQTVDAFNVSTNDLAKIVVISQNAPNPFHNYTTVNYDLKGHEGQLLLTDVAGRQIKNQQLDATGQVQIGNDLQAGIYFYSLIVDGAIVTTKRLQKL
ncbi:MAG: T9SS type A sorting domain-containing protein [Saprospiraceae bacterium]